MMAVAPSDGGGGEVSSVVPLPEGGEEQLQGMTKKELKQLLQGQGWPTKGNKNALICRILERRTLQQQLKNSFRAALLSLGDAAAADASVAQHAEGGLPALQHSLWTKNLCFASKAQRASFISRALYSNVCMI